MSHVFIPNIKQERRIKTIHVFLIWYSVTYPILNTERAYKWRLSSSARPSQIGILCFDWIIHPGVSYSREINIPGDRKREGFSFVFAIFVKRSANTTRMASMVVSLVKAYRLFSSCFNTQRKCRVLANKVQTADLL